MHIMMQTSYQTKIQHNRTRNLETAAKYTANLGYVYEEDRIVTQDYKKAFELYSKLQIRT